MTGNVVSQLTIDQFIRECTILKVLPKEVCLTIHLGNIIKFYMTRIGIHPVLESWDELRHLLLSAMRIAKKARPEGLPLHIRFTGGNMSVWMTMRIYSLCVYEADALFYAGDCIIKI